MRCMLITQPFVQHSNIQYGSPFGKKYIVSYSPLFHLIRQAKYNMYFQSNRYYSIPNDSFFIYKLHSIRYFHYISPKFRFFILFQKYYTISLRIFLPKSPKSLYRQRHLGTISSIRTFPVQAIKFSPGFSAGKPSPVTVPFLRTVLLKQFISSLLHLNLKTIL